ncbi:hypothetical protein [Paenarthrobacter sp. NPDC090522]|uniref:hypothetical protein n=1 Tax=Paenarthrobacter sp. NPDC090522 TaxID=3364383 RepID=UPI0038235356
MSPDLATPTANTHAEKATALLDEAQEALAKHGAAVAPLAAAKAAMAQAHATLAAAQETRAAAYDTRTAAYVTYLATLTAGSHADAQHAAVVDKLIRDRLNFTPDEGETTP